MSCTAIAFIPRGCIIDISPPALNMLSESDGLKTGYKHTQFIAAVPDNSFSVTYDFFSTQPSDLLYVAGAVELLQAAISVEILGSPDDILYTSEGVFTPVTDYLVDGEINQLSLDRDELLIRFPEILYRYVKVVFTLAAPITVRATNFIVTRTFTTQGEPSTDIRNELLSAFSSSSQFFSTNRILHATTNSHNEYNLTIVYPTITDSQMAEFIKKGSIVYNRFMLAVNETNEKILGKTALYGTIREVTIERIAENTNKLTLILNYY